MKITLKQMKMKNPIIIEHWLMLSKLFEEILRIIKLVMVKAAIPMEKPKESYMKYTNIRRKAKVTNILYVCLDQTDFLSFSIVMGLGKSNLEQVIEAASCF